MKDMTEIFLKLYNKIKEYPFIISFNFYKKNNEYYELKDCIEIRLAKLPYYEGDEFISLKFQNVCELNLGDVYSYCVPYITIIDVSENGFENIRYKITEDEHSIFSFLCEDFEFIDELNIKI